MVQKTQQGRPTCPIDIQATWQWWWARPESFAIEYDIVLALGKIRRAGFTRHADTLEGFVKRFDEYRRARIIPAF